jgi:20S proteasome subunit alpha 7
MSGIGTGYDQSSTTFSPDGKVFQTEYAQKAVDNASTVIGLRCKDGVVLAVEKLIVSKFLVEGSNRRIFNVDKHVGVATAGLAPDGRQIVNRACDEASNYKTTYGEAVPSHVLSERIASYVHLFNLYHSFRPFGVAALIASYDKNGPALHVIEPSGNCYKYFGSAVGKGRQAARNEIEKLKLTDMTARQAVNEAVRIIHSVHDEDGKTFEIELSWICEESGRVHQLVPKEIQLEAERLAKAALADSDMED